MAASTHTLRWAINSRNDVDSSTATTPSLLTDSLDDNPLSASFSSASSIQADTITHDLQPIPLAVIGWSSKFPGEAVTAAGFWDMLCNARTAHGRVPQDRFNVDAFHHSQHERSGSMSTKHAHFLKQDIRAFDAPFFSIPPAEALAIDPQQRLMLETAYHALENAGVPVDSIKGSNTSVYVGSTTHDYDYLYARDPENAPKYLGTGLGGSIIPNRISWFFDLRGESMTVDTACSSSLTCLHLAAQSLRCGETNLALVGGVQLMISPDASFFWLSNMGFLNSEGRSYSFDSRGNGYAKGEGSAMLVVKRLEDAIRDGNTVRAVIRATGTNQDGRTPGLTQPSQTAQEDNIRAIYKRHHLDLDETCYVEAHGTGTQVGDPTECTAIARAFNRDAGNPLYIGAVKTNIGHLEAAAGLAGVVKTIMVLEQGLIPPNALLKDLNPQIKTMNANVRFPTKLTAWPKSGLRRASVNSFGYGGTNAHIVMDDAFHYMQLHGLQGRHSSVEYPPTHLTTLVEHEIEPVRQSVGCGEERSSMVFVWSAAEEAAVKRLIDSYKAHISSLTIPVNLEHAFLRNLSFTLATKRTVFPWKTFKVANSLTSLERELDGHSSKPARSSEPPSVVFVFTGQGAQWHAMGRELLCYPLFAESIEKSGRILLEIGSEFSALQELLRDRSSSRVDEPLISQTICTVVQLALVDLMASWGILPDAVIGHSSGEIATAYCAGSITFESAIKIAYYRGFHVWKLLQSNSKDGAMISVSLSATAAAPYLEAVMATANGILVVACENSPTNITVSGDRDCVSQLNSMMEEQGIFARVLNIPLAYHSPHMEVVAKNYLDSIQRLEGHDEEDTSRLGKRPVMFSTVTGEKVVPEEVVSPHYWVKNMISTVKFASGMQALTGFLQGQDGESGGSNRRLLTLEVGPHPALKRPLRDILSPLLPVKQTSYLSLLVRNVKATTSCLEAIGTMYCHGIVINLDKVNSPEVHQNHLSMLTDLPEYPFNHSRQYWDEPRMSKNFRFRQAARHELLGVSSTDWNRLEPHWRHFLKVSENPWMQDHVMDSALIYPASGMIVMAIEAVRQLEGADQKLTGYHLTNVQFMQPLRLNKSASGVEVQLRFHRPKGMAGDPSKEHDFSVYLFSNDTWVQCCAGTIKAETADNHSPFTADSYEMQTLRAEQEACLGRCTQAIPKKAFYDKMASYGCEFGPAHQTLEEVRFSDDAKAARATVFPDTWLDKYGVSETHVQPYVIHPTDLDGIVQLSVAAFTRGGTMAFPTMVATNCKSMWISHELFGRRKEMKLDLLSRNTFSGLREADFTITAFDRDNKRPQIIIEDWREMAVTNLRMSQAADGGAHRLFYSQKWELDIDFMSHEAIQNYCEEKVKRNFSIDYDAYEFELVSMYYTSLIVGMIEDGKEIKGFGSHTVQYLDWAQRTFDPRRFQELMTLVPGGVKLSHDAESRDKFLKHVSSRNGECALTVYTGNQILDILSGKVDPLEVVYEPTHIRNFYQGPSFERSIRQIGAYVQLLAHKNPNLRVIDVGAGTGSGSRHLLEALVPPTSNGGRSKLPKFERYDFTDISPQFFESAEEWLSQYSDRLNFAVLNLEKDPLEQGFVEGSYDVVLAGCVLHAISDIGKCLQNVRKLLRPGGKLLMMELVNPDCARVHFIFGLLFGWWLGVEDYRAKGPLMTVETWDAVLRQNGFSGVDINMKDDEDTDRHMSSALISTAIDCSNGEMSRSAETVIVVDEESNIQTGIADSLAVILTDRSSVEIRNYTDITASALSGKRCVVLKEAEDAWLVKLDPTELKRLQTLVGAASDILWVTSGTGVVPTQPSCDLVTGFGRNVRSENFDKSFTHLGLDILQDPATVARSISEAIQKIHASPVERREDVYRIENGQYYVGRIHEHDDVNDYVFNKNSQQGLQITTMEKERDRPLSLSIGAPGLLDTLHFTDDEDCTFKQGDNEVEVQAAAVGINFRDVLTALGKVTNKTFGYEFSGTVLRAGQQTDFKPGDRVYGITDNGAFKTNIRADARGVVRMVDDCSFEEAAAMPIAFATSYYCLVTKANLQPGETVLIHSAAGGVGQAAVQLAKSLGATVFATVGNDKKKKFVVEKYGIPESHVFSSRTPEFVDLVLKHTEGNGVDVILNSLSGDLFRASWSAIAPLGRFVEIGKSDISSTRGLQTQQFLKNISFIAVDLMVVLEKAPTAMQKILNAVNDLYRKGSFSVSHPLMTYSVGEIETAFRSMQGGKNIGKAVVRMEPGASILATPSTRPMYQFSGEVTYVIAGGFGGLGASFVEWMASRGARNFLIPSRSGDRSNNAQNLISRLSPQGIRIVGARCDIADEAAVKEMIDQATRDMPTIRGVIQAAGLLRDGLFANLSHDDWTQVLQPKVHGTWNLHRHLPKGMDFFVVTSSIACLTGSRGQANYAAGNAYQDALVRYRLSQGERAFSMNIGPVKTVGLVAKSGLEDELAKVGFESIQLTDLLALLEYACNPHRAAASPHADDNQVGTGLGGIRYPQAKPQSEIYWLQRPFCSALSNYYMESSRAGSGGDGAATTSTQTKGAQQVDLPSLLKANASCDPVATDILLDALMLKLSRALNISVEDVEASKPIHAFGVDSLVSLEIRYWFMKEGKANLSVFDIMGAASLKELSGLAWTKSGHRLAVTN